jgi:predicted glycoside hydrolase/deacetylase ChbG (UPF0249 family)
MNETITGVAHETLRASAAETADEPCGTGALIINADDWGRDQETTDRTMDCVRLGTVSSVSAMMFMEDSERAAGFAQEHGVDAGLHLNFTNSFFWKGSPRQLSDHQHKVSKYLRLNSFSRVIFNPWLKRSFEYVANTQLDEYRRLYGTNPSRIDGHHHMHLCANVLGSNLLPVGTNVRRNFSFQPDEKGPINILYRKMVDRKLSRRHKLTDFFFSLPPLDPPSRLHRIVSLAQRYIVEVETHPVNVDEYQFLMSGEVFRRFGAQPVSFKTANSIVGAIRGEL